MNYKKYLPSKRALGRLEPYMLLLPCYVSFAVFTFWPFLRSIYLTLTVTNKKGDPVKFVGLANWERILGGDDFGLILGNTFKFAIVVAIGTFSIACILALLCLEQRKGTRIYQTMYALPMAIAAAPASAIFMFIFMQTGILNMLLHTNISWLNDPKTAIYTVASATIWLSIGSSFIFLLVGFRAVPEELIESARIDGAGKFTQIFKIILPIASPQIFFVIFLNITNSFKAFGQINLLTGGGPANQTTTLVYAVYKEAMLNGRFESACVYALVLFLVIFIVTRIQLLTEKKLVHYD